MKEKNLRYNGSSRDLAEELTSFLKSLPVAVQNEILTSTMENLIEARTIQLNKCRANLSSLEMANLDLKRMIDSLTPPQRPRGPLEDPSRVHFDIFQVEKVGPY